MSSNSPTPPELTVSEVFGKDYGNDGLNHERDTRLFDNNPFSGSEEQEMAAKFVLEDHRVDWDDRWGKYMAYRPEEMMRVRIRMDTETGTKLADEEAVERFEEMWDAYKYWRTEDETVCQVHIATQYTGFRTASEPNFIEVTLRVTVGVATTAEDHEERDGEDEDEDEDEDENSQQGSWVNEETQSDSNTDGSDSEMDM